MGYVQHAIQVSVRTPDSECFDRDAICRDRRRRPLDPGLRKDKVSRRMDDQRRRPDPDRVGSGKLVRPDHVEKRVAIDERCPCRTGLVYELFYHEPTGKGFRRVVTRIGGRLTEPARPFSLVGVQHDGPECEPDALDRRLSAVVVPVAPVRIKADRLCPYVEPRDQERVTTGRTDHGNDPFHHVGICHGPLVRLQRSHGGADHSPELPDAQFLDQQLLDIDEVADRDHREAIP